MIRLSASKNLDATEAAALTTHRTSDGDDHSRVEHLVQAFCTGLAIETDENEVSDALDGDSAESFVATDVILVVTEVDGSVAADGTVNIGTSSDGSELLSAQALTGLDTVGDARWIPLSEATFVIAGDATIYANVEAADSTATSLTLDVYLIGRTVPSS